MITSDFTVLQTHTFDVCVVGSGPVSLCLAAELYHLGLTVLVLESGLRRPNREAQELSDAEITNTRAHHPMSVAVSRVLGGASRLWGGRCAFLDEIDFSKRAYIPHSGWPLDYSDISSYERRAAELLGCGDGPFVSYDSDRSREDDIGFNKLERWVNQTDIVDQRPEITTSDRIVVLLDATVVGVRLDTVTRVVEGLRVARKGRSEEFRGARDYVLAMGGVETTRLLLNAQKEHPRSFGGEEGPLGRYYMGHISGALANIRFYEAGNISLFTNIPGEKSFARRRLTIAAETLVRHQLPNIAFWPDNPPLSDPQHGSGFLSLAYLALNAPTISSRFVSEAIREMHLDSRGSFAAHLWNLVADAGGLADGLRQVVHQRYLQKRKVPRISVTNKSGVYPLHFHAEQFPNPANRIRLVNEQDAFGLNRVAIDFGFDKSEFPAVRRAHDILDKTIRRLGLGELVYREQPGGNEQPIVAPDGLHQIGSTRMSDDPSMGVVDADCRVHGVQNLFIAGSSVFPTSGQASPTLPAVALAVRLAADLQSRAKRAVPAAASRARKLRILFVTASYYPAVRYGGPIYTVHSLARALAQRGHDVVVYTTNVDGDQAIHSPDRFVRVIDGVTVHYFSAPFRRIYWSPSMIEALNQGRDKFDIIHAQGAFLYPTVAARRAAAQGNVPFAYSPRGMLVRALISQKNRFVKTTWINCFEIANCAQASFVHATSDIEAQDIEATGIKTAAIEVIANGIDAPAFESDEDDQARRDKFLSLPGPYIIVLGRVSWKKGLDRLIRSFPFVRGVNLVIAGNDDENYTPQLQKLAEELGVSDRLTFAGPVYDTDKFALLRGAKLFVLASYSESFGVVLLEALSCGTPVVMTPEVGAGHELEKLGAGVVTPGSPHELAETINRLLDDPLLLKKMSDVAKKTILDTYSWDRIAISMERAYFNALDRAVPPSAVIGAEPRALDMPVT